jgi:hypothetical protein
MFPRWSEELDSKISNFMKNLDPDKEYSENEMKEMCKDTKISDINHLCLYNRNSSKGYGCILKKCNNSYKLHKCLLNKFNEFFNYN